MTAPVTFIDTSVLVEILDVPMMCSDHLGFKAEFQHRIALGQRFVIPISTIIETGNHIAQVNGDRHAAAIRFEELLTLAIEGFDPFVAMELAWDREFIQAVLDGSSTGQRFVDHAAAKSLGTGDLSIVAQRDRFLERSSFQRDQVEIWTKEHDLGRFE